MTDKTPTDAQQYLNVASQCAATATSELAKNVLVDDGSGTLRELLNDAADAIRAGWGQPAQAAEPVAWLDPWTGTKVTTDYDAYGKHGIPLYAAPQPVAREPLTDEAVDLLCKVGPVYVLDGKVTRTPAQYRDELKAAQRYGLRKGERAHGIKGGQHVSYPSMGRHQNRITYMPVRIRHLLHGSGCNHHCGSTCGAHNCWVRKRRPAWH